MRLEAPGHGSTLRDYLQVVRRRRWIILQAVVLVPFAAVLFSLHQDKQYEASAQVLLSRQNLATALTGTQDPTVYIQADRLAQTQADVARVPTIVERVLRRLDVRDRTVQDFLSASSVSAAQNADLLRFRVTDGDPFLARRLVDGYARQYTIYRHQLDTSALQRARASVDARIRELTKQKRDRSALYASLVDRSQQLATMEALQTSNAYLVQRAQKAEQVQPKPVRNGILGLALGIVLGIGLAFLWEALDTRVRSAEEIGERLGRLPLLARLPEPPRKLRSRNRLVMLQEPNGAQSEAFRMLRTNLEFTRLNHEAKSILVTSAVEQEGKTTTIANLAVALARAGNRVALVDLDLRRPFLHQFFDLEGPGLTQVAIGYAELDDAIHRIALTEPNRVARRPERPNGNGNGKGRAPVTGTLDVLASGPIPPDPGEFVGTQQLAHVLDVLKRRADVVLVDSPPLLHVGDAMTLSSQVDGILVVTRMNVVRRPMLNEAARLLATSPADKLGFVVTGAGEEEGYGSGYGGYGYGYTPRPYTPREDIEREEIPS